MNALPSFGRVAFVYDLYVTDEQHFDLCNAAFWARGKEADVEEPDYDDDEVLTLSELLWGDPIGSQEVDLPSRFAQVERIEGRPKLPAPQYFARIWAEQGLVGIDETELRAHQPKKSWKEYRETQFRPV